MSMRTHPFRLDGRVALVTGATRGLGFEIAQALALAGAQVWLNGRDAVALQDAAERIRAAVSAMGEPDAARSAAHALPFDVADDHARATALASSTSWSTTWASVIAGHWMTSRSTTFAACWTSTWWPLALAREAAQLMQASGATKAGRARIINITSIAGPISRAGDVAYTVAKGGLDAATRALAAELGPRGITVNAVAPGYFATEANAEMINNQDVADWLARRTSLGRWGRPEEIAGAAVFLASQAASYITGQTLAVDGGYLSHF